MLRLEPESHITKEIGDVVKEQLVQRGPQERNWQRTVEEIVDARMPEAAEQIVDLPAPHVGGKLVT